MKNIIFLLLFLPLLSFSQQPFAESSLGITVKDSGDYVIISPIGISLNKTVVDTIVSELYMAPHYSGSEIRDFVSSLNHECLTNLCLCPFKVEALRLMFSQLGYIVVEKSGPDIHTDVEKILGYYDKDFQPIEPVDIYDFYFIGSINLFK